MCELTGQMTWSDLDIWSGKMFPELSVPTAAKTSEPSLKKRQGSAIKMPLFLDLRDDGRPLGASWETDGVSLGVCMTRSSTAFPKDGNEFVCFVTSMDTPRQIFYLNAGEKPRFPVPSKLSDILEENADPKYSLSARACQGILNRAERRGKELPRELKEALIQQSLSKETESTEPTPQDATAQDGVGGVLHP